MASKDPEIRMNVPFFQVPNAIFEAGLTEHELVIYMYLARCGNHGGQAFPSYNVIANKCGVSRRTAIRAVGALEDKGLLTKQFRKGEHESNRSNVYYLNCPQEQPKPSRPDPVSTEGIKHPKKFLGSSCPDPVSADCSNNPEQQRPVATPKACDRDNDADKAIKTYMRTLYRKKTGRQHPRLKAEQYRRVYDTLSSFMAEMGLGYSQTVELMATFLNSRVASDWNINHFATEGILMNRLYETPL